MIKKIATFLFGFTYNQIIIPYWGKIIGFLMITLIGYRFTFARDKINRNKKAVGIFNKIMSEEREKLIKSSVMDIHRQKNAYVALRPKLFIIQKMRIRWCWNKYIEAENKQKEYVSQWILYHNKDEVLKRLTKLANFK